MGTVRLSLVLALLLLAGEAAPAAAQSPGTPALPLPTLAIGVQDATEPSKVAVTLQIVALLTVLSLAPAILILTTSFTRIAVVLSFLRTAIGTSQLPPNQIVIGLALFLTFFVMRPTWTTIHTGALVPYFDGEISSTVALERATSPMKEFMLQHTRTDDLSLFMDLREEAPPDSPQDLGFDVLVPSFVISELRTAFQMGFVIYVPFLIIDMVVASVLMSMGMLMLPPILISLPFKILLFVLVDGWYLVVRSLAGSFQV